MVAVTAALAARLAALAACSAAEAAAEAAEAAGWAAFWLPQAVREAAAAMMAARAIAFFIVDPSTNNNDRYKNNFRKLFFAGKHRLFRCYRQNKEESVCSFPLRRIIGANAKFLTETDEGVSTGCTFGANLLRENKSETRLPENRIHTGLQHELQAVATRLQLPETALSQIFIQKSETCLWQANPPRCLVARNGPAPGMQGSPWPGLPSLPQ